MWIIFMLSVYSEFSVAKYSLLTANLHMHTCADEVDKVSKFCLLPANAFLVVMQILWIYMAISTDLGPFPL